ncbi:MAG: Hsp20/alpha crystallin family protein [Chitinophagaceae bacterium]|nr:Hsp20/alpha crystallin family protein [Chitinophagaceae bacterium]
MSLIRRNDDLFPAMPSLFNDLFTRDVWNWGLSNNSSTNTTIPAINIRESNDSFHVELAAPGMKKDDFKVELDNNMLIISSEKEDRHEENQDEKYSRREFSYQSFQRTFQLPKDVVDADKIEAKYENGLLHLVIPKKEEAKQRPPRMINIS